MINNKVAVLTIAMILVVGIVSVVGINATFADSKKAVVNNCVVDKDTGKCELKQIYKTKSGDIDVTNNIDVSALIGSGGNGNFSGVDEGARQDIATLQGELANIKNQRDTDNAAFQMLLGNFSNAETERGLLTDRVGQQADLLNTHTDQIAEINATLQDAIIDIDTGNGGGGGNTTDNNTGGGNETGNITG